MIKQDMDIKKVVIIIVVLRPIVSPIQPNIKAPKGLNKYVEQNADTEYMKATFGLAFGKNNSFSTTAI